MTRASAPWWVRPARQADRARLAKFVCADAAAPWTIEVERFIRTGLLDWAEAPGAVDDDPRVLLVGDRKSNSSSGSALTSGRF